MLSPQLDAASVTALVEDAVTAPSMHNAQPWAFRYRPGTYTIELHGDPERAMTHSDPDGRALHLGCAAALFNLRVSAAKAGWEPVTELLPSPKIPGIWPTSNSGNPPGPTTTWRPCIRSAAASHEPLPLHRREDPHPRPRRTPGGRPARRRQAAPTRRLAHRGRARPGPRLRALRGRGPCGPGGDGQLDGPGRRERRPA